MTALCRSVLRSERHGCDRKETISHKSKDKPRGLPGVKMKKKIPLPLSFSPYCDNQDGASFIEQGDLSSFGLYCEITLNASEVSGEVE